MRINASATFVWVLAWGLSVAGCSGVQDPTADGGRAGRAERGVDPLSAPPLDFQESRRFSPAHYSPMAKRLVPVGASAERAAAALVETRLAALERDLFEDDWLYRSGAMVLLGEERGRIVALTPRFYADIRYPDPKLIVDGIGSAEIGAQYIDVMGSGGACTPGDALECETHRFRVRPRGSDPLDMNTVESLSYDDHDITLLYFHTRSPIVAGRPTLGIEGPSGVVERHIREAEQLFGQRYSLVSSMSMAEMRRKIRVESAGGKLLIMATGMALGPVVSHLAGEVTEQFSLPAEVVQRIETAVKKEISSRFAAGGEAMLDVLEGGGEAEVGFALAPGLTAFAHVPGLRLSEGAIDDAGRLLLSSASGAETSVALAGVAPPVSAEEIERLREYLKGIAGAEMARVDLTGDDDDDVIRAVLVMPGEKVVINLELLRHGLARLDSDDIPTLRTFPELREAAAAALAEETGFARRWRADERYVQAVGGSG